MLELKSYIDGEMQGGMDTLDCFDPACGSVYAKVHQASSADVDNAVAAAKAAQPVWGALPAETRANYLRAIAARIENHLSELARAESVDTGKPISVALNVDIPRAAANFKFFADAVTQFATECHATDHVALNYTLRQPLGTVACISPWNLPLYLLSWKIAPALAAGNTVVAKPSEVTPYTATLLAEICRDIGLPRGVLNIVHGTGARVGDALVRHTDISAISFTGSTRTGASIAQIAAPLFKKVSLEMGGKNATIVFDDCDFDAAVSETARAAFSNQGQICLCGSRILVQRSIYDAFKQALVERIKTLRVGDPLDPQTQFGAVVSREHFDKIMTHIAIARADGGTILCGGDRICVESAIDANRCKDGWFIAPTVIEGLAANCQTNQEEIFGPVATLIPFDSDDEALSIANSIRYGLAASVWTSNIKRAHGFAAQLRTGLVWINCWMVRDLRTPFGGIKESGVGREGGFEALRFFTEPKNVCVKL